MRPISDQTGNPGFTRYIVLTYRRAWWFGRRRWDVYGFARSEYQVLDMTVQAVARYGSGSVITLKTSEHDVVEAVFGKLKVPTGGSGTAPPPKPSREG